jgi:urea transport system permease protein
LAGGRFGQLLIAIRDDEPRVRFTGYDPTVSKSWFCCLSGPCWNCWSLKSAIWHYHPPRQWTFAFSIEMVIWVAVGGRGTLVGYSIPGTLRVVNFARSLLSGSLWLFFQGALLFLAVVTVLPDGFVGWF